MVDELQEVLGEKPSRKSNKSKSTNASSMKYSIESRDKKTQNYKVSEAQEESKGEQAANWMMIDPATSTSEEKSVTEGMSSSIPKSNEDSS